jgi:hypothetical protein
MWMLPESVVDPFVPELPVQPASNTTTKKKINSFFMLPPVGELSPLDYNKIPPFLMMSQGENQRIRHCRMTVSLAVDFCWFLVGQETVIRVASGMRSDCLIVCFKLQ